MPTVTLTPTACTQGSGFTNLYYYGNSSNLRQLIFTIPNNAELATGGVAITSIALHYYVQNTSSVAKQLMFGFKTGTSVAPSAWATMDGQNVVEGKFTAIPGVSKKTQRNATKSYSEGSILIDWLLQAMQAGKPVYLGVVQPTSGNSIQVNPGLNYWKIDVSYEIRGNIPTTDVDTCEIETGTINVTVDQVLADSSTTLVFAIGDNKIKTLELESGTLTYAYTPPASVSWYFQTTETASLVISAVTYVDGVEYGTVEAEPVTLTLPDTAVPWFCPTESKVWPDSTPTSSQINAYVQNQNGVLMCGNGGVSYNAHIVTATMTVEGQTYTQTFDGQTNPIKLSLTHPTFTTSGTVSASITLTDTRGRSTTKEYTYSVLPWSAPKIQTFTVNRANEDGTEALDGTCALSMVKASVSSLIVSGAEKNSFTYTVYYREILDDGEAEWIASDSIAVSDISGTITRLLTNSGTTLDGFNDMSGYEFQLIVTDLFGSSTAYDNMPTKLVYMDIDESTGYIGFGGAAPEESENIGYRFHHPADLPLGSLINTYSTDPTPVGTWLDGRTIYRQVYEVGTVSVTATGGVTTILVSNTPTYDALLRLEVYGRWGTSGSNLIQIPRIWTTTTGTLSVDYNANCIRLRSINNTTFTLSNVVVIAEFVVAD